MNLSFLRLLFENIIKSSPILISLLFIFLDSIPIHFFESVYFGTYLGWVTIYSWITVDQERIRPLIILFLGILIDLFNHLIFGITSFFLLILLLLQRKNSEILNANVFTSTWFRFLLLNFLYLFLMVFCHYFFYSKLDPDYSNILFSTIMTTLFFPLIFWVVNFLNEKVKDLNE